MNNPNVRIVAHLTALSVVYPGEMDLWKEEHIVSISPKDRINDVVEACKRWFLSEKWQILFIQGEYTSEEAGIDLQDIIDEFMQN